ncbi:protein Wnt-8a-like [Malaya genurostris]|uniref:protein Wnt-8a-like n=1 Tax=Malaya genurostris TaxID=325434 RepID=UPI0026F39495|nr:protein Wnt-8a-like [Malaya genurostris]
MDTKLLLLVLVSSVSCFDMQLNHPSPAELLSDSIELALASCRHQFRWDRWNCPMMHFVLKRSPDAKLDRETAFVRALSTASLIYSYARNCSRGTNETEQCSDERQLELENSAVSFRLDTKGYGSVHNRRAGWMAVQNAVRKHCRCHGVSGSCAMRTCWSTMKNFAEIAAGVKRMYRDAVRLFVDNSGKLNSRNIRIDQLVYIHPSPNYCQCSAARGANVDIDERKSCRNLCRYCGLKVRKQIKIGEQKCNCRFKWCCHVACDKCVETLEELRCQ